MTGFCKDNDDITSFWTLVQKKWNPNKWDQTKYNDQKRIHIRWIKLRVAGTDHQEGNVLLRDSSCSQSQYGDIWELLPQWWNLAVARSAFIETQQIRYSIKKRMLQLILTIKLKIWGLPTVKRQMFRSNTENQCIPEIMAPGWNTMSLWRGRK